MLMGLPLYPDNPSASTPASFVLTAETGAYVWTGNAAGALQTQEIILTAEPGIYVWSGFPAADPPAQSYVLAAEPGAYNWTGNSVPDVPLAPVVMTAEPGAYSWTGNAATLTVATPTWPNGYRYRTTIVIGADKIDGTAALTGFRFRDRRTADPTIKPAAAGGQLMSAPYDIRYEDAAGNVLAYRIDAINTTAGNLDVIGYLPTVSATADTIFYRYTGKAGLTASQEDIAGTYADCFDAWHTLTGASFKSASRDLAPSPGGSTLTNAAGNVLTNAAGTRLTQP